MSLPQPFYPQLGTSMGTTQPTQPYQPDPVQTATMVFTALDFLALVGLIYIMYSDSKKKKGRNR